MNSTRWILALLLGALGAYASALNWMALYRQVRARRRGPSWIPFFGGAAMVLALLVRPGHAPWRCGLLALVLDAGCLPGFLTAAAFAVLRRVRRARD